MRQPAIVGRRLGAVRDGVIMETNVSCIANDPFVCFRGIKCGAGACVCEPGWMHDSTLFKSEACTMPRLFVDVASSMVVAMSVIVLALTAPHVLGHASAQTRIVLTWSSAMVAFMALAVMSYWATLHANPSWWFFSSASIMCTFRIVLNLFARFLNVASKAVGSTHISPKRMKLASRTMVITGAIPLVTAFVGSLLTDRDVDHTRFNAVVVAYFFLLPLHELTAVPFLATIPRDLERVMAGIDTPADSPIAKFRTRLRAMRIFMLAIVPPMVCTACFSLGSIYLVWGTVPFQFVIWFALASQVSLLGLMVLYVEVPRFWRGSGGPSTGAPSSAISRRAVRGGERVQARLAVADDDDVLRRIVNIAGGDVADVPIVGTPNATVATGDDSQGNNVVGSGGPDEIVVADPVAGVIRVFPRRTLSVRETSTFVGKILGGSSTRVAPIVRAFTSAASWRAVSNGVVATAWAVAVIAVTLTGVTSPLLALVHFVLNFLVLLAVSLVAVDLDLLYTRLARTSFFQLRAASALLGAALLGDAFGGDARCLLIPGIVLSQLYSFAGDAHVASALRLRGPTTVGTFCGVFTVFALLQFDGVTPINTTIVKFDLWDFSLPQLCRDIFFANALILLQECVFVWRGAHHRRFMHLTDPCWKTILSLKDEAARAGVVTHSAAWGASQIQVRSGAFVRAGRGVGEDGGQEDDEDDEGGNAASAAPVLVEQVALRQSDAWALYLFGPDLGRTVFTILSSRTMKSVVALADVLLVLAVASLFVPELQDRSLALLALPAIVLSPVRQWLQMSRQATLLLLRRIELYSALLLVSAWIGLVGILVEFDERFTLCPYVWLSYAVHLLEDASVVNLRRSLIFGRLAVVTIMVVLSVTALLHRLPRAQYTFVDLHPSDQEFSTADDTSSWDLSQTTFDLGAFLTVNYVVSMGRAILNGRGAVGGLVRFTHVRLPISPTYVAAAGDDGDRSDTRGGEIVVDVAERSATRTSSPTPAES